MCTKLALYTHMYLYTYTHTLVCCILSRFSSWYPCYWPMFSLSVSFAHRKAFPLNKRTKTHNTASLNDEFCKMKINRKSFSECLLAFFPHSLFPLFIIYLFIFFFSYLNQYNENSNFFLSLFLDFSCSVDFFLIKSSLRMNLTYCEWTSLRRKTFNKIFSNNKFLQRMKLIVVSFSCCHINIERYTYKIIVHIVTECGWVCVYVPNTRKYLKFQSISCFRHLVNGKMFHSSRE